MRENLRGRGSGFNRPVLSLRIFLPGARGALLAALFCVSFVTAEQAAAQQTGNTASTPETAAPVKEKMRLTPDEAVSLAIKNNLTLESGRVTLDTKKRASDLVWNQFLPDLTARGTLAMDNKASTQTGVDFNTMSPYSIDLPRWHVLGNFSASLTLSAALGAGIQAIKRDYQAGTLTFEKAKIQTERDVRKAYYQILLLQENRELLMESVGAAQRQVDMAEANYRAGLASQLTLLQAQVSLANMQPNIDQVESGLKMAQANFAMTLGLPYDTEFELVEVAGEPEDIPLDVAELISQASRNKPDILELKANILTLESQRKVQSLQRIPYLNLSWGLSPTFLGDPFKDSWGDGDNWRDSGTFSITLGMTINGLFPFTKEGQGRKDMDNTLRTTSIGLTQMIRGTELEVYNTVLSLERIRSTREAQNRTVDMAQQSYQSTEEAYRAGHQDLLQVQNAELELRRARVGVLEQYFNYLTGLIDLEYAIGVPFGTLSSQKNSTRSAE